MFRVRRMKTQSISTKLLYVVLFVATQLQWSMSSEFYELTALDIEGKEVNMAQFRDKTVLIVNVASECGYTDQHYKQLVELQSELPSNDFTILAFPCNQFGNQEPKRNSAILRLARHNYGVKFPMFSKIKVLGETMHPIYKFLLRETGKRPTWNFNKYLIDREGTVVKYWDHQVPPQDCLGKIRNTLSRAHAIKNKFETFRINGEL